MDGASIAVIVVALVGAVGSILSNIVISNNQSKEMDAKLHENQAVMTERLDNLAKEVNKHNNFAEKIPELKFKIENLTERIKEIEDKIK